MTSKNALYGTIIPVVALLFATSGVSFAVTSYDGNAPTAPTNLKATAYSSNTARVVLTWNQALDNIGVTRYNIYRNGTFLVSPSGVGVTYSDTNVVVGQTYTYAVQAGDGDGNNGPQSETVEISVQDGATSKVVSVSTTTQAGQSSSQPQNQAVTSVYDNVSSSYLTEKIKHPEYITLTAFDTHLAIGWKSSPQWKSVRVIKKESSFPISIHDGKVICDSATGTQCIDKDVTSGKTYYYGVYSVDQTYMTSNLVLVSGALQSKKIVTDTTIPAQQTTATSRVTPVQSTQAQFTKTLRVGSKGQEVLMLQQFLNVQGFVIATSGAGSKGQETTLFGRATESALKAYQCKRKIVCDGSPESTGYGVVGKTTRMYLNNETSLGSVKGN